LKEWLGLADFGEFQVLDAELADLVYFHWILANGSKFPTAPETVLSGQKVSTPLDVDVFNEG
jgi:hypothetical protein